MKLSVHEACKPVGAAFPRISKSHFRILHHTFLFLRMQDLPAPQLTLHAYQQLGQMTGLSTSIAMEDTPA